MIIPLSREVKAKLAPVKPHRAFRRKLLKAYCRATFAPLNLKPMSENQPSYLEYGSGHRLAYFKTDGKSPTVVFMGGLKSDMTGTKALFLEKICQQADLGYIRFDYTGHGRSGGTFREGTIGDWHRDTLAIIDQLTVGPLVVIGSSMGGWQALLATRARPDRVKGLIGLAAAPDFTENLLWPDLTEDQKKELDTKGEIQMPSDYEEPYIFTKALFEDGKKHLLLDGPLKLDMPVRLIHGLADKDVPHWVSEKIMTQLDSPDATLTLIEGAGHSLSEDSQLRVLQSQLQDVVAKTGL